MRDEFLNCMMFVFFCCGCFLAICISLEQYGLAFYALVFVSGAIGATTIYILLYVEYVPQKKSTEFEDLTSPNFGEVDLPREKFYVETPPHLDGKDVSILLRDGPPQIVEYYDYYTGELLGTGRVRKVVE